MDRLEEIKTRARAIISSNVGDAFVKTGSLETIKYIILIKQIVRKRLKYNCLTSLNWKRKEIKLRTRKILDEDQKEILLWLQDNEDFLIKEIERLLKRFSKKL